jgi:hypothetical protein
MMRSRPVARGGNDVIAAIQEDVDDCGPNALRRPSHDESLFACDTYSPVGFRGARRESGCCAWNSVATNGACLPLSRLPSVFLRR